MTAADVLPEYHHRERHSLAVDASPERALAAAKEVRLDDVPVVRILARLRGMRPGTGTLWDALQATRFREVGDDTIVAVGKPWQPRGGVRPHVDDFAAFDEPGYAKMAVDLRFADGRLTTETRVFLTSPDARRRFRAYWLVIRPFSGLSRRLWLRAAKRRAEA